MNGRSFSCIAPLIGALFCSLTLVPVWAQVQPPGLGPAGKLVSIEFENAGELTLNGPGARRQLVVTGRFDSGQLHDLTRQAIYATSKPGVANIDREGFVTPLANGEIMVTARAPSGQTTTAKLTVESFDQEQPINFANEIVPVLTKLGCNTGACHGKATGQNGFRLSLLGFYPEEDYEYVVKQNRGRRVFPAAPEFSLLLLKPTNTYPHGGGMRLEADTYEGRLLRRWIEQGMPYGRDDDPVVERIEVQPASRMMNRNSSQQVSVFAHYSDGTKRDVTRLSKYEANDSQMAEVAPNGLVHTLDRPGEVAVMARFQDHVSVFRASIPLGFPVKTPAPRNFIDQHVFAKLRSLGIPPSEICDDATFIRRVSVDITGRLPTADAAEKFIASKDPKKRDKLIDQLLNSPDYADYFTNKWNSILRNKRTNTSGQTVTRGFHKFVRDSFGKNMRYDQFVRTLLTAQGDARSNPPAAWFDQVPTPVTQAEDVAQLFLGQRIQCAHCHHHPYEKWNQDDYFGLTAFFSRVKRQVGKQKKDKSTVITHNPGEAKMKNPRTGKDVKPTGLDGEPLEIPPKEDPRAKLVDWMTQPENPFFAKALANRYWKHFLGRGIVDPEDDMRVTNPPSNPALLDALAQSFVKSGFDLKALVRTICRSNTYQLSSFPNEYNADDRQNFSHVRARRLNAEVLYDALDQVTGATTTFKGLPAGTRAMQLPDNSYDNYFLAMFGKPKAETPCECERGTDASLAQSLYLLNSPELQGKISAKAGRVALLVKDEAQTDQQKLRSLYFWVYSRPPKQAEIDLFLPYIEKKDDKQSAFEDVLWTLMNANEFIFNN